MCKLSVKATCQNPLYKSVPSNSFLTHLICPSLRHLSAQIVLLINYAIIPIRWLIAGSSSTFLLQISSLTTPAARGRDKISDAACSCMTLQLPVDTADLRQAASVTGPLTPRHLSCPSTVLLENPDAGLLRRFGLDPLQISLQFSYIGRGGWRVK